jgi:divalent metal cation (Fe/Co/Zn/Cd) transporter
VLTIALSEPLVHEAHDITIFEHGDQVSMSLHLKFPADRTLHEVYEIAERVETAIGALPRVSDVHTHLEPLERPIVANPAASQDHRRTIDTIDALVREHTGEHPREVRVLPTETGTVVFMTVPAGPGASLAHAHELASEVEEQLRQHLPEIADVVVHTVPEEFRR